VRLTPEGSTALGELLGTELADLTGGRDVTRVAKNGSEPIRHAPAI
jgi:hypothetical protein